MKKTTRGASIVLASVFGLGFAGQGVVVDRDAQIEARPDAETRHSDVRVEPPSSRFQRFEQRNGLFSIEHPANWRAQASDSGYAVSLSPEGGVVDRDGQQVMLYGVIVSHYAPFDGVTDRRRESRQRLYAPFADTERWSVSLEVATDDLVRQIIRTNAYLGARDGLIEEARLGGVPSFSVVLSGRSPITGQQERVTVVTRAVSDGHVLYALCIGPGRGYDQVARTFAYMMGTLNVSNDRAQRARFAPPQIGWDGR
jgi:hypothetical protein